jgi:hypothetical protein
MSQSGGELTEGASTAKKLSSPKRERLKTPTGTYFAKRTATGRFKELDEVGRSLAVDRRGTAKKTVKSGFGDQGDQKRSSRKK